MAAMAAGPPAYRMDSGGKEKVRLKESGQKGLSSSLEKLGKELELKEMVVIITTAMFLISLLNFSQAECVLA